MKALHSNVSSSLPQVPAARLVGHDGPIQTVKFTSDGKYCLTGGHDRSVRLWNPFRVDPAHPIPPSRQVPATSNDGPDVIDSYYGPPSSSTTDTNNDIMDIRMEDLPRAMPIQTYTGGLTHPVSAVAVVESSDTQQLLLAACDKTLVVMDLVTNQVLRRFQGHVGLINALGAAHKGEAYLSAGYDGTVCIWDGRSSRDYKPIQVLKEAKDSVTDLYVVPQNNGGGSTAAMGLIRTASVDGMVRTYDLRMGVIRNDNCHSSITSISPTYDGQCLAISCLDGTIRLMELETGELLNTYQGSHKAGQYGLGVAILADDATIVSGSEDGHCVLYDLVRATCVQSLQTTTATLTSQSQGSPQRPTCAIAAHPKQSSVVITTSYDESAIVWANDSAVWQNQMLQE